MDMNVLTQTELPTSYCTILFDDTLVYRTRAKAVSSKPIFNAGTERFMRDWRSGIVTVTVRDQRNREHDPILGVVPLRLSEILSTSSQVTRWYPLDGGIGFGRARISLLFRSVETRLPPNMLGWDVGTFEFISDRIVATGWKSNTKLKLRTGGSVGKIPGTHCHRSEGDDGVYFDVSAEANHHVRLPVKHRYRSPIIFEFHVTGKRGAAAYASLWLQNLIDNEDQPFDIPIWTTKNGDRLLQNYINEENAKAFTDKGLEDLKEVGRLQFHGRFKAGMDESHRDFIVDNNTRETYETFEACLTEGVRERVVQGEVPDNIQELHEASLKEGRDILETEFSEKEKRKWKSKSGQDWSGAFSHGKFPSSPKDRVVVEIVTEIALSFSVHANGDLQIPEHTPTRKAKRLLNLVLMSHLTIPTTHQTTMMILSRLMTIRLTLALPMPRMSRRGSSRRTLRISMALTDTRKNQTDDRARILPPQLTPTIRL